VIIINYNIRNGSILQINKNDQDEPLPEEVIEKHPWTVFVLSVISMFVFFILT
jgi:hypothetical protein